ncbi:MAG: helicase-related protein, partial [Bdellovibrionales bacterium]
IDQLVRFLRKNGNSVAGLHGDMTQPVRTATLAKFKEGDIHILVCSDVAARGIDIKDVSHVFNYDVPMNADDYVHRIGRTGRAGASGEAWTLATESDEKFLAAIYEKIGKDIPVQDVPESMKSSRAPKKAQNDDAKSGKAKRKTYEEEETSCVGFGNEDEIPAFLR